MRLRIPFTSLPHTVINAMMTVENTVNNAGFDTRLLELVRLRVAQLNHCAYCIDMHYKEAIAAGEQPLRLYSLSAWTSTPFYDEKERAVLAWTEAVTLIMEDKLSDPLVDTLCTFFDPEQLANLTLAIAQINTWTRLAESLGFEPGQYQAGKH